MEIRRYTPADHPEWLRMRRALWPEIPPDEEADDAASWLARPDATVLVAARSDRAGLAGFVLVAERPYADGCATSPVCYLEGWYVDLDARRTGVGAALVRAAEQWGRERGHTEFASDALLDNLESQRAHDGLGFVEVERAVRYRKPL